MGHTSWQGLGYKEVIEHLEAGVPLAETIERIRTRTRQFARRQYTWFRNLEECNAVEITGTESADEISTRILRG